MKIKICGLKSLEDINMINKYEVDYVGFVFAESKRKISKELARDMKKLLNKNIKVVGVFVNTNYDEINEIVKFCGIDIVQLYEQEENFEYEKIIVPVWKAISMKDQTSLKFTKFYENIEGFLLDGEKSGSGKTFNWNLVKEFSKTHFTILGGGLNSENIQKAIKTVNPNVVDVSSGVEIEGKKNEEKIKKFIRKVNEYEFK